MADACGTSGRSLIELAALDKADYRGTLRKIAQASAQTLRVERVGFWELDRESLSLRNEETYRLSLDSFEPSGVLLAADYPTYFRALKAEQVIVINRAIEDPRTAELAKSYLIPNQITSMMDIPVWIGGALAGVVCHEHVVTEHWWKRSETTFGLAAGQMVATALEVRQRLKAEAAERRSSFLAQATALLCSSLDVDEIPMRLAQLCAPQPGSGCVIQVIENGTLVQVARAHAAPTIMTALEALGRDYPVDLGSRQLSAVVVRTGKPVLLTHVRDEDLLAYAVDRSHFERVRELGVTSLMAVPIIAHGSTLGVMYFFSTSPLQMYQDYDLERAIEVSRSAAIAVVNARLFNGAKEATRIREEFLAIAAHELRTPLTSLQLALQGLTSEALGSVREGARRAIEVANRQAIRLRRLVENLLDVSRLQARQLNVQPDLVDLSKLVRTVADNFVPDTARAGTPVRLSADRPVLGFWDATQVEQVVANLLSNAIKFGCSRPIEVSVECDETTAFVSVRDHGIGIAAEKIACIFERFERAVSPRAYGGLGIGLFVVRGIVDALGGAVHVDSLPGQGSTFTVMLPLNRDGYETVAKT